MHTAVVVTVVVLLGLAMIFCIGMCRAASDADDRMEERFRRKGEKEE